MYGNLREQQETANLVCYKHPAECMDYSDVDMGEALMDDDGDEEQIVVTDEYTMIEYAEADAPAAATSPPPPLSSSSPEQKPATEQPAIPEQQQQQKSSEQESDEISPRGAIVEVSQRPTRSRPDCSTDRS